MLSNDVNYRITIEPSTPSIELLLVFSEKNLPFAITPTWPRKVFSKKTLIF